MPDSLIERLNLPATQLVQLFGIGEVECVTSGLPLPSGFGPVQSGEAKAG
jgi:hypothetical protein